MNQVSMRQHVPVLDGIRGLAILMVIVCHTLGLFKMLGGIYINDYQGFLFYIFGNGWLGVDLFFVLSGYLITGILINSKEEKNYFVNFYARRSLRIFPIYYLYITVIIFVLPMFVPYMSNQLNGFFALFYFYLHNIVPLPSSLPQFLLSHLWSLAVEEHFYLIWPLVVYKVQDRRIFYVGAAVIIAAIALRMYIISIPGIRAGAIDFYTYRFTMSRADALILGAMLAYAVRNAYLLAILQRYRLIFLYGSGLLSLTLFIYGYLHIDIGDSNKMLSSIGYTLYPIFFTFMIFSLLSAGNASFGRRLIDNAILRFFGKYSYALYIVHFSVIAFIYSHFLENFKYEPLTKILIIFAATIVISSVISLLSYHLLEKHFLYLKKYFVSGRSELKAETNILGNELCKESGTL